MKLGAEPMSDFVCGWTKNKNKKDAAQRKKSIAIQIDLARCFLFVCFSREQESYLLGVAQFLYIQTQTKKVLKHLVTLVSISRYFLA